MQRQRLFSPKGNVVTWAAFVLMLVVAAAVGGVANREVVSLLHERLLSHGMERSRDVAKRTAVALHKLIDQELGEEEIIRRFKYGSRVSNAFGYALILVDVPSGRVVAHSDPQLAEEQPRLDEVLLFPSRSEAGKASEPWQGVFKASSPSGVPQLAYFEPVDHRWTLGVASDLRYLVELEKVLTSRLNQLLMVTVAVIAALGFLVVRGVGRRYERTLERAVLERTREVEATHAQLLHKTRLASIGQTASMLIHELRNPLASMKLGMSDLVVADTLDASGRRRLNIMLDQVDRLDGLLSQVLDYVRPVRRATEPVAMDALLDYAIELLDPLIEQRGVHVLRERCIDCPGLPLDRNLMSQALVNLLKNALEASPDQGGIEVRLRRQGADLVVEIANRGALIPEADLQRIFEPFVTSKSLGTGLGLPMVKRVVEEHGGSIRVSSDLETGTRFVLTLPVRV